MVECKNGGFFRTSFLSQTFLTYRGRSLSKSENPDLEGKKTLWKNSWKDLNCVMEGDRI